jgi:hypothetical protein
LTGELRVIIVGHSSPEEAKAFAARVNVGQYNEEYSGHEQDFQVAASARPRLEARAYYLEQTRREIVRSRHPLPSAAIPRGAHPRGIGGLFGELGSP